MDLIVKFLFLSGKYITCAAGKTILELVNQSVKIHRHVSCKYEQLTQMVGPYDNMLELFNARIEDNPLHYLAMPAGSSCNQSLAPAIYTEVPRTLIVPYSYECESEDLLAQEHQYEEVGKDKEYEQIYQDLCEDLHKSSMELQNEMQDNQQATPEISQTFIPLYDDDTDEVHDVPSHDTITNFHFIPKKKSPETPKHHHNSEIPVHQFFRSRLYSDCSQDCCADICNLGLVSMCDRYAHMNHLLTDAPDDSYFKKNAFTTQSETPKVDSNTGMYNLRTILLHPNDMVENGSNESIENDYKDEITHRTFVIKKNCEDCIDKFRDNVTTTVLRRPQKLTSQQSSTSFDAKLRNKILGIISRNMSSSNFTYDMDLEDICDDLMQRVKQETKLIRINQTAFNKLEQKVTQLLINQSWKDIEKVFARGRREKNVNTEEIKKLTFDEINSNTSIRIRDAVVASKNKKRTKEDVDGKPSSTKFATLAKEEGESTGRSLNPQNRNAIELFTKLKHLENLSKELDSFCSIEDIEKIPITQQDTLSSILLAPLPEIASPMEIVTPSSKTMDETKMVNVTTETQSAAKNESTKKTGLTDHDIENMRERSKIIDSNMKAFRIFEDNLKKVVILDKPNEVKGGPKVMKEEELAEDKTASSDKKNVGGKLNANAVDYKEATKVPSPTLSTKPNNVKKIVSPKCDQPKSDFIVTDRKEQETPKIQTKEHVSKIGDNPADVIIRQSKSDFKRTYGTEKCTKEAIRMMQVNSEEEHRTDEMKCRENIDMLNKELYNNQPDEVDNSVSDLIARLWDKPSTRVSLESSVYVDANTLMFPQSSDAHSVSQADDSEYRNEDEAEHSQKNLQERFTNRLKRRNASDTAINAGKKKKVLINIYVSNTSVCDKAPVVKAAENLVSVLKTSQSLTQLMKKNHSSISNYEDDQIDEKEVSLSTASKEILIDVERVWKMQQSLKPSVNVEKLHVDTDRLSTVQQSLKSAVEPVKMEPAACPKIDVEQFYRMQQHLTPTMPTSRAFSVRDSVTTAPLAQKIVDTFDRSTTTDDAAKDNGHFIESMFGQYGHFFQPYLGIYASRRLDDKVKGVMSEHVTSSTKATVDTNISKQHSMNDFKIDYGLNNELNSISFKDSLNKERSHYLDTASSNASKLISKFDKDNENATIKPISDTKVDNIKTSSKDLTGGQSNSKGNLRQQPLMAANKWNYNAISSAEMNQQHQESNDQNLEPTKSQHTVKAKNIKLKYDANSKEITQVVFNANAAGDTDIFETITENATALLNKFQGKNNNSSSSSSSVSRKPPREDNEQSTLRKMFDFLPNENLGFAEPTEEPLVITNKYTKPTDDLAVSDTEKPLYQRLLAFLPVNKSNNTTCSLQQVRPKSDSGKNDDIDRDIDYIIDKNIERISKKRSPNDEEANMRKLRAKQQQRTNRYESKANENQEDTDQALQDDYNNNRKKAKLRDLDRDDVPLMRDTQTRETREYVRMKKTNDSYDDQDTPDEIDPRKTAFSYEKYKEAYRDKIERSKKYDAEIKHPSSNPKLEKRIPEKKAKFGQTEDNDGDLYKNLQRSLTRKKSKSTVNNHDNRRQDAPNDPKLKYYQPKPMAVSEQFPKMHLSSKQDKEAQEKHSAGRQHNDNYDHRYHRKLSNTHDDTPDVYVKEYEPEAPTHAKKRPEYHAAAPPKPKPMVSGDNHDQNEVYENRKEIRRDRDPRRTDREYTRADEQQLMGKRPASGAGSSNYQWKPLYPTEQKSEGHSDFIAKPQKHVPRPSERRLAKEPKSASQLTAAEEHQKKAIPQTHYSTSNLADNTEDRQDIIIGKDDNKVSIKVDINQPKMKKISFEFKPFNPNNLTRCPKQPVELTDQSKPEVQTNQTSTYKVLIKSNDDGEVTPKVEESYEEFQAKYVSKHSSERSGDDKPDQAVGGHVADDISPGPNTPSQKTPKLEYIHPQHSRNEEPRRHPRAKAPEFDDGAPIERQHLEEQPRVEKKSSRRYIEATREKTDSISQYERKGNKTTREDNSKKSSHQSSDPEELYRRHSKRNLREMQQVYTKPKQRVNDRYQPLRMVENTMPSVSQAPKVEQPRSQERLNVESKKRPKFKMPKYSREEKAITQSEPIEEHNEPVQRTEDNLKYRPPEKRKAEDSQEETSTSENMSVSQQINQLSQLMQQQQKIKENNETLKSKEYSYQQQEPIKPEAVHQEEIVQDNEMFMHPIEEEQVVHAPRVKEKQQAREVPRATSKDHQYAEDERIDERSDFQEESTIKAFAEESKPHIKVSEDIEPVDNHQPAQKTFEFRPLTYKSPQIEPRLLDHSVVKTPMKKLVKSFEYNHMESKIDKEISQDVADYYKLFHPQISHTPKLTQSQKYYRKMQVAADGMGGNIAPPPPTAVSLPPFKMPQRPRKVEPEEEPEPRQQFVPPVPKLRAVEQNREEMHVSKYKTNQKSQQQYQTEKEMSVEEEKPATSVTPSYHENQSYSSSNAQVEDPDLPEQPSIQGTKKKPEWRYQAQQQPNTYASFGGVDKSDPAKFNTLLRAVHEKARKHMEERRMLEDERKREEERKRALEKPKYAHVTSSGTVVPDDVPKPKQPRVVYKPGGVLTTKPFKFKPLDMPKKYAEVEEPRPPNPKPRQAPLELKKVEKKEHGDIRRVFQFKPVDTLDKFGVDKVLPEVEIAESLNNARLEVSSRSKINKTEEQREALVAEKLAKRAMKEQAPQKRPNQRPPSRPNSKQRSKPSNEFIKEKSDDRKLEGRKTEEEANEKKVTQSPYTHKSLRDHQNAYPRQNTDPQPRPPTPAVSPKENNIGDYVWTNESHNPKHGEARTETSKLKAIITKSIQNTQLRDQQQQTNVTNNKSEFDRGQYLQPEHLSRSDHRRPSTVQSAFGNARAESPRRAKADESPKTAITAQMQMEMSTATAPMKRLEPEQEDEEPSQQQSPPPKPSFVYSFDDQYRGNKSNDSIRKKRYDYWKKLSRIDNWAPVVTDPTIQNELYRPKVILKVQRPEERIAEDQPPLLPEYGPGDDENDHKEQTKAPVKPKRSMKELKLEQSLDKRLSNVSPLLKHYLKEKAMAKEKSTQDTPVANIPSISTAIRRNPPNNTILIEMTPQENIYQKYPLLRKGHNQRDMEELAKREQDRIESEMKAHAEENLIKLEKIKLAAEMQPSPIRKELSYLRDTAVKFKADVDKYSNMMKWKMKYMAHVEKLNAPRKSVRKSRENLLVKKFPFLKKFRKVNQVTWPRDEIEHWDPADYAPVKYDLAAVSKKKPWYSEEDEKSEEDSSSKMSSYEDSRKKYKYTEKEITSKFGKPVKITYLVDDEEKQ